LTPAPWGLVNTVVRLSEPDADSLQHEALVYDSDDQLVDRLAAFVREEIDDVPTIAVLTRAHWSLLREELGDDAERVAYTDCADFYSRPIDAISGYDAAMRELLQSGAASVRVAGEIPLQPNRADWSEWIAYEAIFNRAFVGRPAHAYCVYGTETTPDHVIDAIWRTHPTVEMHDASAHAHYHDPREVVSANTPAPAAVPDLKTLRATNDPTEFRELLAAELAASSAPQARMLDLLIAANEVFENANRYAGGPSRVRAGLVDGWFVCEIDDRGPGLDDPFAGFLPPRPDQSRGAGLWVARRLVRRLELLDNAPGLTVRLWL
jgi:anti-sigma regulatory factor (Ser/Thr protein kinase)